MITLWQLYRGGEASTGHLPDGGGVNDQAAWVIDALEFMETYWQKIKKRDG